MNCICRNEDCRHEAGACTGALEDFDREAAEEAGLLTPIADLCYECWSEIQHAEHRAGKFKRE